ncbi:hypothetical protein LTSEINV_1723 [Salmonella enterica subsp. enterica serovar Inverness str. R8-3668]|uniref:Uncharacterized protein n=1 Tax=Salmonella enterica subsp. enterica serovar Inverness str. R8-3668 TaxID=913075 RepID=G5NB57_SALET|nr:hypothetical protein LTSEINV_1723 [Salmonella enterica subsp. enterica serovar Inverness str. R8-3668]
MSHNNYFSGVKMSHNNYFSGGVKNKKTASGARPEAVKFTLLLSQGRRFISSAIAAAS